MSGDILKEFLVAIGFKADTASLKRAEQAIGALTKATVAIGAAIVGTAAIVEAGVSKMSEQMEELYYAARRAGSTVDEIQAVSYAFGQIGLSAQEAKGTLAGLFSQLTFNPGTEGFLHSLHIQTRQANGELRDTSDVLDDFVEKAKTMPPALAAQYASMLGISQQTLLALEQAPKKLSDLRKEFRQAEAEAGIDGQALGEASKDFQNNLLTLGMHVNLMWERVEKVLLPIAMRLVRWADEAVQWFNRLDGKTDGLLTTIALLAAGIGAAVTSFFAIIAAAKALSVVWEALNISFAITPIGMIITGIVALAAAIAFLVKDFLDWKSGADSLIPWDKWKPEIDALMGALSEVGDAFGELWQAIQPIVSEIIAILDEVAGAVMELGAAVWKYLGPAITQQIRDGLGILVDVLKILGDGISIVADILTGKWGKAWEKARDIATHVLDAIKHAISGLTALWPDWMREALGLGPVGNDVSGQTTEPIPPPDDHQHADEKDHSPPPRRTAPAARSSGGGGGSDGGRSGSQAPSRSGGGGGAGRSSDSGSSGGILGGLRSFFGGLMGSSPKGGGEGGGAGAAEGGGARGQRRGGGRSQEALPDVPADAELGALSRHFESRGDAGAIGWDSTGGESYGQYQIASKTGTMKNFLNYLAKNHPEMSKPLEAAGGIQGAEAGTAQFKEAFKQLAKQNPEGFAGAQHDFIKSTHYDPLVRKLQKEGLDVTGRSKALQDVIWSTAVAHGGGTNVVEKALGRMGKTTAGAGSVSDEELIKAIYAERKTRYGSSTERVQAAVQNRYNSEQTMALRELANGGAAAAGNPQAGVVPPPQSINPAAARDALAPAAQASAALTSNASAPLGQGPDQSTTNNQSQKTVTVNAPTTITVSGAQDPQATGRAVAQNLDSVHSSIIRNAQGAAT
jgi:TP901 family phage tail tape measure protein